MGAVRKFQPAFFYSVLLHGMVLSAWFVTATLNPTVERPAEPKFIMVEMVPLPKAATNSQNQVVQTETVNKSKDAAPDAFLGEQTQIVQKQTISMPKVGTAPQTSQGRQAQAKPNAEEKATPKQPARAETATLKATGSLAKFGIAIATGKEDSPKPERNNPIEEAALTAQARGEYVKGFKPGEQTMLNTREFVFFGYFQRIRERLDRAWEKSLRERLAKYFYRGRQLASETDYMTQLLVSLDDHGRITRVQIIGASGTKDLDEAAIKAFNDAGPFPNPPRGLVDNAGQIQVRWDFVLKT